MLFGAALALSGCGAGRPAVTTWNLLLITLDTVRADHLGSYGYTRGATPNLDSLAAEGARFLDVASAVPLTLPSHATILSGLLPPRHGVRGNGLGAFPADLPTLATELQKVGYRTAAFVGSFVLDHRFGLARGFDHYDDDVDRSDETRSGLEAERPARVVVDRALAWLDQDSPQPFFAWIHLYDAHAPYEPPEPFAARFADRPYDGEIASVDTELGRVFERLSTRRLAERTVVVALADHGEALGEHGELTHGLLLYEPTLKVPWLIRAPGLLAAGKVVKTPVSLADVAPTLLALLGRALPASPGVGSTMGRNLAPELLAGREPTVADLYSETRYPASFGWSPLTALRHGSIKYIAAPTPELYDLARDPGEQVNRTAESASAVAALATGLEKIGLAELGTPASKVDPETRARLAALGYVASTQAPPSPSGSPGTQLRRDPKEVVGLFRSFEEAHWAVNEGRLAAAVPILERLVTEDPGNAVFRSTLAKAVRSQGNLARAIELYRRSVVDSPKDPEAWYNLATTLQEAGHYDEALTALTRSLEADPDRPEALNALGIAYAGTGRLADAARVLDRACRLDPKNARAWNNLGNVERDLGHPEQAEQAFRHAMEIAPRYPDPWNGMGTLEVARDRPQAALPFFEQALSLDPGYLEARLNQGIAFELAGDRQEAITAYREFLSRAQGNPQLAQERQHAEILLARLAAAGS